VAGLLVCAIDGTVMTVADSQANLAASANQKGGTTRVQLPAAAAADPGDLSHPHGHLPVFVP
jgi:hypothetical protein